MMMKMMTFKKTFLMKPFLLAFCLMALSHPSHAATTECEKAKTFMSDMGSKVITLLTNKSISDQERADEFRTILENNFNVKAIGKFVLGRYWKQATDEEKKTFLHLFKETTVAAYASRFKDYTSEKFEVLG